MAKLCMLLAALLWSTSGLFIKLLDWHPFIIAGFRAGLGAIFMIAVELIKRNKRRRGIKINNLALKDEVCCSHEVLDSGSNTQDCALKGGVLDPSPRIENLPVSIAADLPRVITLPRTMPNGMVRFSLISI